MSLGNLLACLKTSYGSQGERVRGRVAVAKAVMAALPRCSAEPLEGRVLLSDAAPSIDLFNASPAVFVENQGQWADQGVRYAFDGAGCAIGFRDEGVDFRLSRGQAETSGAETDPIARSIGSAEAAVQSTAFSLRFEGANRVQPVGEDRAETVFNYFVGEQSNWRSNVAGYGAVAYEGLYAGVDLRMAGQRGAMKYEFHVAPGGDYRQIQLRYEGIGGLAVGEDGSLAVDLGEGRGRLVDDTPVIYQEIDGRRVEVAGRFVLLGPSSYGFEVTGAWEGGGGVEGVEGCETRFFRGARRKCRAGRVVSSCCGVKTDPKPTPKRPQNDPKMTPK